MAKELSRLKIYTLRRYFSQTSCSCKEISPSWSWRLSTTSLSVRISLSISWSRRSTRSETLTLTKRNRDIIKLVREKKKNGRLNWRDYFMPDTLLPKAFKTGLFVKPFLMTIIKQVTKKLTKSHNRKLLLVSN